MLITNQRLQLHLKDYTNIENRYEIRSQFPEAQIFYKEHPASEMYVEDFIVETKNRVLPKYKDP